MMKNVMFLFILLLLGCSEDNDKAASEYTWDIDTQGIPRFAYLNYIELDKISRISKFRSSVGHDYSDNYEQCRSMKHYFEPYDDLNWSTVKIYSPANGTITIVEQEWAGTKVEIKSSEYPAFRIQIFHINPAQPLEVGDKIAVGDFIGTHVSNDTYSDISVIVNDPAKQGRFVSWFYIISDQVFDEYLERGAATREDFIISKELRDANPLDCNSFGLDDPLEQWFVLNVHIR